MFFLRVALQRNHCDSHVAQTFISLSCRYIKSRRACPFYGPSRTRCVPVHEETSIDACVEVAENIRVPGRYRETEKEDGQITSGIMGSERMFSRRLTV